MSRFGWWLMGWPVGVRGVNRWLIRFGPYRLGAWLANRKKAGAMTTEMLNALDARLKGEETPAWRTPANRTEREYTARQARKALRELRHTLAAFDAALAAVPPNQAEGELHFTPGQLKTLEKAAQPDSDDKPCPEEEVEERGGIRRSFQTKDSHRLAVSRRTGRTKRGGSDERTSHP